MGVLTIVAALHTVTAAVLHVVDLATASSTTPTVGSAAGHARARAGAKQKPNVLLFFPDEFRYDWGGLHNNPYYTQEDLPLYTPHFDEIAANGTRFTRAFVGAPVRRRVCCDGVCVAASVVMV